MNDISAKRIVIDLDDTISRTDNGDYQSSRPIQPVVDMLRQYREKGYLITIYSSRNMRTFEGNIGKINVHTLPVIMKFLDKYDVPYDEVVMGKPWAGKGGFYVDDRAVRPSEFISHTEEEIEAILQEETKHMRSL